MIKGTARWDDRRHTYYTQRNNSAEVALSRYGADNSIVTCGPTAAVMCMAAMDLAVGCETPGDWKPQPEDVLMLWFHDKRNWPKLAKIRPETAPSKSSYSPNEVPQYYPQAVFEVFGVDVHFEWIDSFTEIAQHAAEGRAVQIALKKPGHFVSVVAYDPREDILIYHDPWPQRFPDGDGFRRELGEVDYENNVQPYVLIYEGQV